MQTLPLLTDQQALARNRVRALRAPAYFLQELVTDEVEERLNEVNRRFTNAAVITPFADVWRKTFPNAGIFAESDLLGLTANTHDLIIHAMSLHWANDPVGQLVECRQALKPDGLFLGFLFGGQTLTQLRSCLAQAETEVTSGLSPRVLPMGEIRDLGGLLQRAGFALPVADSISLTVKYKDIFHLMADLRAMGEGNALHHRLRHPTQRKVFKRAAQLYHQTFTDAENLIPATFEIICLTGWGPSDSQQKPLRPGSAAYRLADHLRTDEKPLERDQSGG